MNRSVYAILIDDLAKLETKAKAKPEPKLEARPKAPAEEEALPQKYGFVSNCSWKRAAKLLDLFRAKVASYYGFAPNLIQPIYIVDPGDPLKDSMFDVRGICYEVHDAQLTCIGEMQ